MNNENKEVSKKILDAPVSTNHPQLDKKIEDLQLKDKCQYSGLPSTSSYFDQEN